MLGLIIDSFAGGGGASLGIEMALGRSPDLAINHDEDAILMHQVNHPKTVHLTENIWKVRPEDELWKLAKGRNIPINPETRLPLVSLFHASPDCRHHSKAKGGAPVSRSVRGLADVVLVWAQLTLPEMITLENVEEWRDWGPLLEDGRPDPDRKGIDFDRWVRALHALGYSVDWREIKAYAHGTPTIRRRLYLVARRDSLKIWWPKPSHAKPDSEGTVPTDQQRWKTAAEIIDWSLPCPSIFMTKQEAKALGIRVVRPLVKKTMTRIAKGFGRHVLARPKPFVVAFYGDGNGGTNRSNRVDEPLRTVTTENRFGAVTPFVAVHRFDSAGRPADDPLSAVTANSFVKRPGAGGPLAIISPVLSYGQQGGASRPMDEPHHTVTASAKDQNQVLVPHLMTMRNSGTPHEAADKPARTVTAGGAGLAAVTGFVARQFGNSIGSDPEDPVGSVMPGGGGKTQLAAAFLAQHNTDMVGHDALEPVSTLVGKGCTQAPIMGYLASLQNNTVRGDLDEPVGTVLAKGNHHAVILPFVQSYYSTGGQDAPADEPMRTVPTLARFSPIAAELVAPPFSPEHEARARQVAAFLREEGVWDGREADGSPSEFVTIGPFVVVDIGMRMLIPRELARAQGLPDSYDLTAGGRLTETAQRHKIGNTVCPQVLAAILRANLVDHAGIPATPRSVPPAPKIFAEQPMLFAAE